MNRRFVRVRNHKLAFSLAVVPLLLVSAFSGSRQLQASKDENSAQFKPIELVVPKQPDAPVAIASSSIDSSIPNRPRIAIKVANVSNSPVRAFTIRCDTRFAKSTLSAWALVNIQSLANCFRPHESRTINMDDADYAQPPHSVLVSVDFVEFLDGSRWGDDTYKSGERLDGMRAGAHSETKSLLSKIRTFGEIALSDLNANDYDIVAPSNASAEYSEGFRIGIDNVRARIKQFRGKKNLDEIVNDLLRPIDLSDVR